MTQIHLHDRHVFSYPSIADFASKNPGTTLILLDYHHDCGPFSDNLTSFNWVGKLIEKHQIAQVIWVSGRTLEMPNRNSRMNWLNRKLKDVAPTIGDEIRQKIRLMDWHELQKWHSTYPIVVSLDLDILTKDPGNPPERFLNELTIWMGEHKPGLISIALSSAYQNSPIQAWRWLEQTASAQWAAGAHWTLEAGSYAPIPESLEELASWQRWDLNPQNFHNGQAAFWVGPGLWQAAPIKLRQMLVKYGIDGADIASKEVISGWTDTDRTQLEANFPSKRLEKLSEYAIQSLMTQWENSSIAKQPVAMPSPGIAVRLLNSGLDRGCLALYRNAGDADQAVAWCISQAARDPRYAIVRKDESEKLFIELSVFGPWHDIQNPEDFRPGFDSLLMDDFGKKTLLQASVAVERHYDRQRFLQALATKAGLGKIGWQNPGLRFQRACTLWYMRPLIQGAGFQNIVKK